MAGLVQITELGVTYDGAYVEMPDGTLRLISALGEASTRLDGRPATQVARILLADLILRQRGGARPGS
jgi:hypothetical protein